MRSAILESRTAPVENIAVNPNFERVLPGTTVVRKNLHPNPRAAETIVGYSGGAGSVSRELGGPLGTYVKGISSGSAATAINGNSSSVMPVTPNQTIAVSCYGWFPTRTSNIRLSWMIDGSPAGITTASSQIQASPDWARHTMVVQVPQGVNGLRTDYFATSGGSPGDEYGVTGWLVEVCVGIRPYFDWLTVDATGIAYSAEGAPGASPSLARSATFEIAREIILNPNCVASGNTTIFRKADSGGTAEPAMETVDGYPSVTYTPAAPSDRFYAIQAAADAPDGTYFAQIQFKLPVGMTVTAAVRAYNGSGLSASQAVTGDGTWQTIDLGSAPLTAGGGLRFELRYTGGPMGKMVVRRFSMRTANLHVFDGYESGDVDFSPAWLGVENSSVSVIYGVQCLTVSPMPGGGRVVMRSWNRGLRIETLVGGAPTLSVGALIASNVGGQEFLLVAGMTYTVMAKLTLLAPQSSTGPGSRAIYTLAGTDGVSDRAPNVAGTHIVKLTFTCTSPTNSLRLGQGPVGEPVFWDELMVVEGVYTGPYLDGDMPNSVWRGSRHASRSVGYPKLVA